MLVRTVTFEDFVPDVDICEFAGLNGLTLEIHRRELQINTNMEYYVFFRHAEISEPGVLIGAFGNGAYIEDAIEDYAGQISGRILVVGALRDAEQRINVPNLYFRRTYKNLQALNLIAD